MIASDGWLVGYMLWKNVEERSRIEECGGKENIEMDGAQFVRCTYSRGTAGDCPRSEERGRFG